MLQSSSHGEVAREPGLTGQDAGVVAVDDVVDLVLRQQLFQELRRQVIRHVCGTNGQADSSARTAVPTNAGHMLYHQ